tara:strand:+ start:130 stop:300 length:171 start_codon:yes stop_codon:yes gene_type:complete
MIIQSKNGYNLITSMLHKEKLKEFFKAKEIETNKHLFLKVAIMNREQNKNILKKET